MFNIFKRFLSKPIPDADDDLVLVFTPSLASVLTAAEAQMGRPLTEAEVLTIRDKATCMAVKYHVAREMEQERGYPDIVAETAWENWQRLRSMMKEHDA